MKKTFSFEVIIEGETDNLTLPVEFYPEDEVILNSIIEDIKNTIMDNMLIHPSLEVNSNIDSKVSFKITNSKIKSI